MKCIYSRIRSHFPYVPFILISIFVRHAIGLNNTQTHTDTNIYIIVVNQNESNGFLIQYFFSSSFCSSSFVMVAKEHIFNVPRRLRQPVFVRFFFGLLLAAAIWLWHSALVSIPCRFIGLPLFVPFFSCSLGAWSARCAVCMCRPIYWFCIYFVYSFLGWKYMAYSILFAKHNDCSRQLAKKKKNIEDEPNKTAPRLLYHCHSTRRQTINANTFQISQAIDCAIVGWCRKMKRYFFFDCCSNLCLFIWSVSYLLSIRWTYCLLTFHIATQMHIS